MERIASRSLSSICVVSTSSAFLQYSMRSINAAVSGGGVSNVFPIKLYSSNILYQIKSTNSAFNFQKKKNCSVIIECHLYPVITTYYLPIHLSGSNYEPVTRFYLLTMS